MNESTKIDFRYRRVSQIDDLTDLVAVLFSGNKNQQHAAARILLSLKHATGILPSLHFLELHHGISRRTLERTRAKLSRLGLIKHVTWMNHRYAGEEGWLLSRRMSNALRKLADWLDAWQRDDGPERHAKDEQLTRLLR